jgi:rare lipoprotein A
VTIVNVMPNSGEVKDFYSAPPAKILGGMPPMDSYKIYRLQVGAYKVPRNALNAFEKLKSAGLNPVYVYEQNGEYYRVILGGLKAQDIPSIAQKLGDSGFPEAIIREE